MIIQQKLRYRKRREKKNVQNENLFHSSYFLPYLSIIRNMSLCVLIGICTYSKRRPSNEYTHIHTKRTAEERKREKLLVNRAYPTVAIVVIYVEWPFFSSLLLCIVYVRISLVFFLHWSQNKENERKKERKKNERDIDKGYEHIHI